MASISDEVERLIQAEMALGHYASESDLIRDALRSLQEQREVNAAIQEGLDDMVAGRVQSAEDFDRDFRARKGFGLRE
jgi:putative addiction module CopG family antidote